MRHPLFRPVRATVATLLGVLLLIQTSGCTSWYARPAPWPESITRRVRVTQADGPVLHADSAVVTTDSLVLIKAGERHALPRANVVGVEERKFNPAYTVLLVGIVVGVVVLSAVELSKPWVMVLRGR